MTNCESNLSLIGFLIKFQTLIHTALLAENPTFADIRSMLPLADTHDVVLDEQVAALIVA
jgi:hypothetical protein